MFQLLENIEELSSMTNGVFRGVFVHRYRDKLPEIRMACMEELGTWLKTAPNDFLNDGCLKYLGWTLYDKVDTPTRWTATTFSSSVGLFHIQTIAIQMSIL